MHQRLATRQPETVNSCADDFQYMFGIVKRRGRRDQMIAPRAEIFAIRAIEIALHRHVIDRDVRVESEIASRDLEQVSEIREHGIDYTHARSQISCCADAGG